MKQSVLLGMSGGTDSSVAAMILLQQGYEVTGITFRFWEEEENTHLQDAISLAHRLGIKHIVYDAREVFREKIVQYFVGEYLAGRTPFPCAKCNNELKWELIFQEADRLGCDFVSMGHYVNIVKENSHYFISEGVDRDKDQSFFLWGLRQEQLSRIIFPLGNLTKTQVRRFAQERGFESVANKKDSLGVCFCSGDYRDFLREYLKDYKKYIFPGNFVDEEGNILGQHQGYPLYTVGQRRGLIYLNRAVFVKEIRTQTNEVVLAPLKSLYQTEFYVRDFNVVDKNLFSPNFDTITRIRYRKQNTLSRIIFAGNNRMKVELAEPLESIAPGQTAVFYRNGKVLGGGFIE
ncbi:tRNA 2-thiouridine(34) synthase MnmA [Paludibacter sp. 221]|uniref:tRNA 2-thiouridine(34) synthase MnmA n=1 Tax=Paludibacter sp. 221 TaxID=2302939 RepID=UPI0013D5F1FD|nr:tRNA 2-thiouridine(34) synthase MnmA [Paludibacter sp. 221]NDV46399.1 tRNA 2-thiouridine(34) synthase MnmA [Paludibacter sp. 221]